MVENLKKGIFDAVKIIEGKMFPGFQEFKECVGHLEKKNYREAFETGYKAFQEGRKKIEELKVGVERGIRDSVVGGLENVSSLVEKVLDTGEAALKWADGKWSELNTRDKVRIAVGVVYFAAAAAAAYTGNGYLAGQLAVRGAKSVTGVLLDHGVGGMAGVEASFAHVKFTEHPLEDGWGDLDSILQNIVENS